MMATVTSYRTPDGTVVKVGDRIRVVTEGTVTGIELADKTPYIEYENGSDAAAVYPQDGEFVSLTVLRPAVKAGQVWRSGGIQFFVTTTSDGKTPTFLHSSTGYSGTTVSHFFNLYPDAQLVYDPEASHA